MNSRFNRLSDIGGCILAMTAIALVSALFATPAVAAELNVSGTWDAVYHCEAGSCKGQDFPAPGV